MYVSIAGLKISTAFLIPKENFQSSPTTFDHLRLIIPNRIQDVFFFFHFIFDFDFVN